MKTIKKQEIKTTNKTFVPSCLCASILLFFSLTTCNDLIIPITEYGTVCITFDNAGRTIFPSKDFDNIVYTFTKQANVLNNSGETITLSYTFPETDDGDRTVENIEIKTQPTNLYEYITEVNIHQ